MKREIIPAIFPQSADELLAKIRAVGSAAPWIQIDMADGTFVTSTGWNDPRAAARWKIKPKIELHLMVNDPWPIIRAWQTVKTLKRVIWHLEAPVDHKKLIDRCHRLGLQVGLALNPETAVTRMIPFLRDLDEALIMGVHPGRSGQRLLPAMMKKSAELRRLAPRLPIAWDGGITQKNIAALTRHGVTRFNVTSAIFG